MAGIQLGGLFTGIDTNALITQLMQIEQGTINRYQARQRVWSNRQNAITQLESRLQALRSSAAALSSADALRAFTVTSSNTEILTAEAGNNASEGNHTIVVHQLASAERWIHTAGQKYAEDFVGAGTFIYSYNHRETIITTTDETTLEGLADLINNDPNNPGVTANVLYYNDAYHLMLNGHDTGSDYAISINPSNTEVLNAASALTRGTAKAVLTTRITDLEEFGGDLVGGESITISGRRHDGAAVNHSFQVTESTTLHQLMDEINDAFGGTATATLENGTIRLTDNTYGPSQLALSLAYDPAAGATALDLPAISSSNKEVRQTASSFTVGDAGAGLTDVIAGLDQFTGTLVGDESITISGTRHDGTAVSRSFAITGSTDLSQLIQEINDAFGGTATAALEDGAIRLSDHTSGTSQMTLGLTYNPGSGSTTLDIPVVSELVQGQTVTADLAGFAPADFLKTQSAQDAQIKVDGYPTGAAEWITRSSNTIDDVLHGVTLHVHDEGTVQVNLARDTNSVKSKLGAIVSAYNAALAFYEEKTGYNQDTKVAGELMGDAVVSSVADDLRGLLIQRAGGFLSGVDRYTIPGQLGLELDKEGKLTLDADALGEAIADDYAGVLALIGADKTGSSDSNTIAFYDASSDNTAAGTYNVEVIIAGGVIISARIKPEGERTYHNATVQGNTITGNSTFDPDSGRPLYPENGLRLRVDRSQDGTFTATVRVQQGFAGAMTDALDRILDATTGALPVDRQSIDDQIQHLQDQITAEQDRLTRKQSALIAKFARLEKTLALLQNQMAALGMTITPTTSS
jgi:flagellar capping protein FliD